MFRMHMYRTCMLLWLPGPWATKARVSSEQQEEPRISTRFPLLTPWPSLCVGIIRLKPDYKKLMYGAILLYAAFHLFFTSLKVLHMAWICNSFNCSMKWAGSSKLQVRLGPRLPWFNIELEGRCEIDLSGKEGHKKCTYLVRHKGY